MGVKTWQCPNCTCLNILPQTDDSGADLKCVACKLEVHLDKVGSLTSGPIAPKS